MLLAKTRARASHVTEEAAKTFLPKPSADINTPPIDGFTKAPLHQNLKSQGILLQIVYLPVLCVSVNLDVKLERMDLRGR